MSASANSPDPTPPQGGTDPGPPGTPGALRRSGRFLRQGATGLGDLFVVVVLLSMVALPVVSSVWRRFTGQSIPSATVLVQHLTLWVGFLGALLATRAGKHLHLTTLDLFPDGRARQGIQVFTRWVSAAVTAVLAYASARLIHVEAESRMVVGGIPFWWSMMVMPVALTGMSVAFAWRADPGPRRWLLRLAGLSVVLLTFLWSEASLPDPGSPRWPPGSGSCSGRLPRPGRWSGSSARRWRSPSCSAPRSSWAWPGSPWCSS
jgi:TRAP-type C4-dicarboxylate transport system permease small subunit